ncbi:zinc finger domain-containing protein [Euroglyphus maynei]|uniref:Zinc finger domain-containing protein n=1 Tax=Euroglyphus maynei TaxID=6958 RepID=A0A1Y3B2P4_EURMA|nr:zinc finger domain-containing protein [Euroglyphus maynei]
MTKDALNSLKIRDLKWFLASRNISTHYCFEKSELVDLIMSVCNGTPSPSSGINSFINQSQQRRHSYSNASTSNSNQQQQQQKTSTSSSTSSTSTSSVESPNNERMNHDANEKRTNVQTSTTTTAITLDDINNEYEIEKLSIKQLKLLLTRNFVNFKGCVEREELIAKVLLLYNDKKQNDRLKEQLETNDSSNDNDKINNIVDENQCKICWEKIIDCVLLDCGHMITCTDCGPICRQFITRVVHVFKS